MLFIILSADALIAIMSYPFIKRQMYESKTPYDDYLNQDAIAATLAVIPLVNVYFLIKGLSAWIGIFLCYLAIVIQIQRSKRKNPPAVPALKGIAKMFSDYLKFK